MPERRQFERLPIHEDAIAVSLDERRLGRVFEVSGGGMQIQLEVPPEEFAIGQRLHLTVNEPVSGVSNTIHVVVRYCRGTSLGVEFVAAQSAGV